MIISIPNIPLHLPPTLQETLTSAPILTIRIKNDPGIFPILPLTELDIRLPLGPALLSNMVEYRVAQGVFPKLSRVAAFMDTEGTEFEILG